MFYVLKKLNLNIYTSTPFSGLSASPRHQAHAYALAPASAPVSLQPTLPTAARGILLKHPSMPKTLQQLSTVLKKLPGGYRGDKALHDLTLLLQLHPHATCPSTQ